MMTMIRYRSLVTHDLRRTLRAALIAGLALTWVGTTAAIAASARQKLFASPEEAVQTLIAASKAGDTKALLAVLGPDARSIIDSGDPVADRNSRENFVRSYDEANALERPNDAEVILDVGNDTWPFPIPLVKEKGGWRFDTHKGKQEILDRRIGKNELSTIQVCLAIVDAQREYYLLNPQGDTLYHYAELITSTPGKRDGLFWETTVEEVASPLGPLVASARGEGYKKTGKPMPYHGYYYRLLKAQGANASGGAYDYVVRGKMLGGFALVAYPAEYGSSGVMTFMVNHDGIVFEKDLGPNTPAIVKKMTRFDPDGTWTRAADAGEPAPAAAPPS